MAKEPAHSDPKALYDAHEWVELHNALQKVKGPTIYRGAVAAAFNDPRAESILRSVIQSAPHSAHAYEAYELLSHVYLRTGQYRRLISVMEERWAAFPNQGKVQEERKGMASFRGLPDQGGGKPQISTLQHDGTIFIPISIHGLSARYFFDTGAWLSCMSESEAKRLGLTIHEAAGTLGTSTGLRIGFRTAVAGELKVGNMHFKNVSFAVFPDDQEPWSGLPPSQRGILGIPVLLAFRALRWSQDGTVLIGLKPGRLDPRQSNLFFDDDHLVIAAGFQQRKILVTLDTGAVGTDLYGPFAKEFASLLNESGKKGSTEVRGVGHTEKFDSITVPELRFQIGGLDTVLRPAHVLLKQIGAKCCVGNLGLDLLKQGRAFKIDFGAMTLALEPNR